MAERIQLTPSELQAQAAEMKALEGEYTALFAAVSSELKSVNGNWSSNLAHNFEGKINSAQKIFAQITQELSNGAQTADTCAVTFESVDTELSKLYCDDVPEGKTKIENYIEISVAEKLQEYVDIITGDGTPEEKKDGIIGWLNSIRKDADGYAGYLSWLAGQKINYPEPIKSGLGFIKNLDIGNKLGSGMVNWAVGIFSGDTDRASAGGKNVISGAYSVFKDIFKSGDVALDFQGGLILDYGKNMVTNWLDSIQKETKVSEVYWNTFANSAVDIFRDTVCNTPTLAIAYEPAKKLASLFGYDLQASYENVSEKKGFAAITDTFAQMGELFKENSTWENWKSGMGIIGEKIVSIFK